MSKLKSSSAGYKISSTDLLSLWISSINKISSSCKLVSIAARSPAFSIAGPDVIFILLPISFAIIVARVVFPSPGGPYNNTWSSASPLAFAASIYIFKFSFAFSCPIYSEKTCGLKFISSVLCSKSSSSYISSGDITLSSIIFLPPLVWLLYQTLVFKSNYYGYIILLFHIHILRLKWLKIV